MCCLRFIGPKHGPPLWNPFLSPLLVPTGPCGSWAPYWNCHLIPWKKRNHTDRPLLKQTSNKSRSRDAPFFEYKLAPGFKFKAIFVLLWCSEYEISTEGEGSEIVQTTAVTNRNAMSLVTRQLKNGKHILERKKCWTLRSADSETYRFPWSSLI